MKKNISTISLLMASVSAILGSGWLFSALYTSNYAGPASIISWLIGGTLIIIIAFVYAELCSMIPISSSSTRIPHITHGTLVSFTFSWIVWISYLTLAPIEVQAIIQYIAVYEPGLINANTSLTSIGFFIATILLLLITIINTYSLGWLIRANNFLTILKLIIPTTIGVIILVISISHNIDHSSIQENGFMPYGLHGVVAGISSGGIAFAFTGFKIAAEMAGETKNPKKAIPISIIGSIMICLAIFLLLQFAFLNSIRPENLANGWNHLHLSGDFGPFASIAQQEHIHFLIPLIFIGAIIGPLAAGLMYFGSAARSIYGMSLNAQLPKIFKLLSPKGIPTFAIIINFIVGLIMFAPLPGWKEMAQFLTSLVAFTYVIAPISVYTLRLKIPEQQRPFKLIWGKFWSICAFYASTLIVYWTGWDTVSKLGISIIIGAIIFFIYKRSFNKIKKNLNIIESLWLWVYVTGLTLISYSGNFGGGKSFLNTTESFLLLLALCFITLYIATKKTLPSNEIISRINSALSEDKIQMLRSRG